MPALCKKLAGEEGRSFSLVAGLRGATRENVLSRSLGLDRQSRWLAWYGGAEPRGQAGEEERSFPDPWALSRGFFLSCGVYSPFGTFQTLKLPLVRHDKLKYTLHFRKFCTKHPGRVGHGQEELEWRFWKSKGWSKITVVAA